jgi:hypothetical protein
MIFHCQQDVLRVYVHLQQYGRAGCMSLNHQRAGVYPLSTFCSVDVQGITLSNFEQFLLMPECRTCPASDKSGMNKNAEAGTSPGPE